MDAAKALLNSSPLLICPIDIKVFVTVVELFQISPIHEKWIKVKETPDGEGIEGERKEFHRERKEYHYDKAKYHEEKENQ